MAIQLQDPPVETEIVSQDSTAMGLSRGKRARPLFDGPIARRAVLDSFIKLNPATLAKNPVMFVVEVGALLTTVLMFRTLAAGGAIGFDRIDHRRELGEFARQFHIGLGRQGGGKIAFQRRMPGDERIEFLVG